jgi:hypothetical protein
MLAGLGGVAGYHPCRSAWSLSKRRSFHRQKLGYTLRRATETGLPNLRSGEPVARMPSAGIINFRQAPR